ncbi:hypothetical protein Btru_039287 [Bulinus truncatus]|nr:hypothetical protein Btru_039287 [Bulinus truncatus]
MYTLAGITVMHVWCVLGGIIRAVLTATGNAETPSRPGAEIVDVIVPDVLEPLPEYIAARPETKVLSRYWAELESRRMATLKMCEQKLWDRTQHGAKGAPAAPEMIKGQQVSALG